MYMVCSTYICLRSRKQLKSFFVEQKTYTVDSLSGPVEEDFLSYPNDEKKAVCQSADCESESETDEMPYSSNNMSTYTGCETDETPCSNDTFTTSSSCECQCCSKVSIPHHPLEVDT